jgi:hypothetical protein
VSGPWICGYCGWDGPPPKHDWCCSVMWENQKKHAALTRALTAQAWGVAIEPSDIDDMALVYVTDVATLPAPADLATEILGGEP